MTKHKCTAELSKPEKKTLIVKYNRIFSFINKYYSKLLHRIETLMCQRPPYTCKPKHRMQFALKVIYKINSGTKFYGQMSCVIKEKGNVKIKRSHPNHPTSCAKHDRYMTACQLDSIILSNGVI